MSALEYLLHFPWVEPLGRTLLHFLWQGALIGLVTGAGLRLLARCHPSARHALAGVALLLCALCPVATLTPLTHREKLPAVTPAALPAVVSSSVKQAPVLVPEPAPANLPPVTQPIVSTPVSVAPATAPTVLWRVRLIRGCVVLWLAGVLLLGLRLALSWVQAQGWRRGARPVTDPAWLERFQQLAARLGDVPARARLLVSSAAGLPGPLAMGFLRPVVLLPARLLESLPVLQVQALLAHELAHLRRYDYLWSLLSSALEVALFYHPAVWYLGRQLRLAREECCDQLATEACPDRVLYARALAAVAEWEGTADRALALAAATRPLLTRVRRLLGLELPPEPLVTRRNAGWALALATVALTAFGILQSGRLMAQKEEEADPTVPVLTWPVLQGRVVDANGAGVAGARVSLLHMIDFWSPDNGVIEEVTTGADGRFALAKVVRFHHPKAVWETPEYTLFIDKENLAPAWQVLDPLDPAPAELVLKLGAPIRQTFVVQDRTGQPVAGATVRMAGVFPLRNRTFLPAGFHPRQAITDAAGQATLEALPQTAITFAANKEGYGEYTAHLTQIGVEPPRLPLQAASVLTGRVVDPLGRPVPGALVTLYPKFKYHTFFKAKTDADGRYRVEKIWSDREANHDNPDWGQYEVAVRHPLLTTAAREVAFTTGQTVNDFNFTVDPGVELRGRLLDPRTKQPVADGTMQVDSPSGRQEFRSGTDGSFQGRVAPGHLYAFFWMAPRQSWVQRDSAPDALPHNLTTEVQGEKFAFDLYLPSPLGTVGVLHGQVRTAAGEPARGCKVSPVITADSLVLGNWFGNQLPGATADEHGDFTLAGLPVGLPYTLTLKSGADTATFSGRLDGTATTLPAPISLQPPVAGGEFLLVDVAGKPRAGLTVIVQPVIAGEALYNQRQELTTDAGGIFRVPTLAPATTYNLSTSGADAATQAENSFETPAAGQPPAPRRTLTLDARGQVRLVAPGGNVVPVQKIVSFTAHTRLHGRDTLWSNELPVEGHAGPDAFIPWQAVVGHRGDRAHFIIQSDDKTFAVGDATLPEDGTNLLVVQASEIAGPQTEPDAALGAVSAGRVVTPEGVPIAGASVRLPGMSLRFPEEPAIVTGADGVFQVPVLNGRFTHLTAVAPGWATSFITDFPVGQAFRITLRHDTWLRGQVAQAGAGPVDFIFKKNKFTSRKETLDHEIRDVQLHLTTEPGGAYAWPIEPGRYRWQATSADQLTFAGGEITIGAGQTADLGAALHEGPGVTFQCSDPKTGQPAPGLNVCIYEQGADRTFYVRKGSQRTSDANGVIHWDNLPPGPKEFHLQPTGLNLPDQTVSPYQRWWRKDEPEEWRRIDYAQKLPTGNDGTGSITLDVQVGLPPIAIFAERGIKITGQVTTSDGAVVPSTNIAADPLYNVNINTDAEGRFIGWLPAGNGVSYHLCAYTWPQAPEPSPGANAVGPSFASAPGDTLHFALVMEKGGWFTGRLLTAKGEPAAGGKVTAIARDGLDTGYASRIATADAEGRYRLGPLRLGAYQVHAGTGNAAPLGALEGAPTLQGTIKVPGESTDLGDLRLPEGVVLEK